jgi:hypothetical protein
MHIYIYIYIYMYVTFGAYFDQARKLGQLNNGQRDFVVGVPL